MVEKDVQDLTLWPKANLGFVIHLGKAGRGGEENDWCRFNLSGSL